METLYLGVRLMSDIETLKITSFLAGFMWSQESMIEILSYPFSSIFKGAIGAIGGAIAVFCGILVDGFVPSKLRPLLVTTIFGSFIYYTCRLFRPSRPSIEVVPPPEYGSN
jgi:membrane-bound metal-dependent hydrolase YbcI (DUF457 family)